MVNELSNLLNDFNKQKVALWMQMRFLEVFASVLAEKLMTDGTQIYVNPDEIKWPDGTVSRPIDSKGNKKKKKKPNSRDGIYGHVVHDYSGRKKTASASTSATNPGQVVVLNEDEQLAAASAEQAKKKTRGTCVA